MPLDPTALEEKSLRFSVFGIDEDERNVSTGVVELKLSVLDLPLQPFSGWLYLQDQNKVPQAPVHLRREDPNPLPRGGATILSLDSDPDSIRTTEKGFQATLWGNNLLHVVVKTLYRHHCL